MEKIYFYVRGKRMDSKPAIPADKGGSRVTDTKVSRGPGYTGAEPGLSSGAGSSEDPNDPNKLTEEEKFVADKLNVNPKDYAASKNVGRSIRALQLPDERKPQSMADVELRRMMGSR